MCAQEYMIDGVNSLAVREWLPDHIAGRVLELMHNDTLRTSIGLAARQFVVSHFDVRVRLPTTAAVMR